MAYGCPWRGIIFETVIQVERRPREDCDCSLEQKKSGAPNKEVAHHMWS